MNFSGYVQVKNQKKSANPFRIMHHLKFGLKSLKLIQKDELMSLKIQQFQLKLCGFSPPAMIRSCVR